MVRSRFLRDLAVLAAVAGVYFVAGKLGLKLASIHASASAVWPCTGIAFAAFLIFGYRVWPAILTGAFLVNITTAGSVPTSIGIAVGNTLEGVVGCYLINRFAGGRYVFESTQNIFRFCFLAGLVSTAVSATFGVTTLALGGFANWSSYASIWSTWWLGDAVGAIVVTPFLLLATDTLQAKWTREQIAELACLFVGLSFTAWLIFGGQFPLRFEPLSTGVSLHPVFNLGRVSARRRCGRHRDWRSLRDRHLGNAARFWPVLNRFSKHIVALAPGLHGRNRADDSGSRRRDR